MKTKGAKKGFLCLDTKLNISSVGVTIKVCVGIPSPYKHTHFWRDVTFADTHPRNEEALPLALSQKFERLFHRIPTSIDIVISSMEENALTLTNIRGSKPEANYSLTRNLDQYLNGQIRRLRELWPQSMRTRTHSDLTLTPSAKRATTKPVW